MKIGTPKTLTLCAFQLFSVSALQLFVGCAAGGSVGNVAASAYQFYNDHYDRALSVSATTAGNGTVSYTITPKQPVTLSDEQVRQLMAHFADVAGRDGKGIVPRNTSGGGK